MKRLVLLSAIALLIAGTFSSCKKNVLKDLSEDEARIYITNYDPNVNFTNFRTFSIVDSVAVISNNQLQTKSVTDYDVQVLATIKSNMEQRGFLLVDKNSHPDLGINVSRITSTQTGIVSYPDYWDYYDNYYDPYYWGYGGYGYSSPYSYGVYQIKDGALSIDILNLKDAPNNGNKIGTVWSALARGTGVFRTANASRQVVALFAQSPYIKSN